MHELRRLAYLEALDIDCYESRRPLPGAAPSRRRPVVALRREIKSAAVAGEPVLPEIAALLARDTQSSSGESVRTTRAAGASDAFPSPSPQSQSVPRFSLTTVVAGDWLWLEELGERPLTTEQVQLMQAMARALQRHRGDAVASAPTRPDVLRFDWPMHNNRQLDSSEQEAREGATAFINRRLEQFRCRGLVLLGSSCKNRLLLDKLDVVAVSTASSAEILQTPACKSQVWRDLLPLVRVP